MNDDSTLARTGAAARPLKERQRAERAALILDAAQVIFAEKGYHAASIDEIAARVGISKGAVYLHFASKEALLEALVAGHITWFLGMVDTVVTEAESVRARLERILTRVYTRLSAEQRPLALELSAIGLADSVLDKRPALRAEVARATERIGALLDEGKRSGELATAIPTPVLVSLFVGLLSPPGFDQLLASDLYPPRRSCGPRQPHLLRGTHRPDAAKHLTRARHYRARHSPRRRIHRREHRHIGRYRHCSPPQPS